MQEKRENSGLANIYLFNRNTWVKCEICSSLAIKILEPHCWRQSSVFIVNFKYICIMSMSYARLLK